MTWFWLGLAGVVQPLAMEAYRWAPWLTGDPVLARLLVREVTLAGPVLVLVPLAVVPIEHETLTCNRIRKLAWLGALGLLILTVQVGLERNAPYRVAFLAQQVLLASTWWCAVLGERRRRRLAHYARLAGFLFASLGVLLCVASQFVLAWGTTGGTVPDYDPWAETPSQAGALGIHWATWALVLGSSASIPLLWGLDRCRSAMARRFQARLLRVGR